MATGVKRAIEESTFADGECGKVARPEAIEPSVQRARALETAARFFEELADPEGSARGAFYEILEDEKRVFPIEKMAAVFRSEARGLPHKRRAEARRTIEMLVGSTWNDYLWDTYLSEDFDMSGFPNGDETDLADIARLLEPETEGGDREEPEGEKEEDVGDASDGDEDEDEEEDDE